MTHIAIQENLDGKTVDWMEHVTDAEFTIADLDRWYKEATARFKADREFATIARKTVVDLLVCELESC